jgi:gas vesicle protein
MNTGKAILGVLTGIVAGATLGLLFAPDKKSNVKDTLDDKIEEKFSKMMHELNNKKKKIESENDSFENEMYN